jgi:hypothetical protein
MRRPILCLLGQRLPAAHRSLRGDYNRGILQDAAPLLSLVVKMQDDYRAYHNNGYETIEGITAGTARFVDFDTYLDAGVPKGEATID